MSRASSDGWARVRELFVAALDQPPGERLGWLARACDGDDELRDEVAGLLRAEAASEGMLEEPGPEALASLAEALESRSPGGQKIGPYELCEELGRGGMGSVFLARQEGLGFERRVALKLLRRGLDTDDLLARFAMERRILANLRHPNIAQLLDAGATDDGRPFLVMELVEGTPITDYCDGRRLSLRERLRLVLEVAAAVQAAHARLVVHRDLKPSNILVTEEDRVKLLDFGIAKLLDQDPADARTRTGQLLLTPDYAAPEQLRGQPVSVATDVYQLGLLLFRLVAGRPPQRSEPAAAFRPGEGTEPLESPTLSATLATSEDLPARAHALATTRQGLLRSLRGDLDTIVAKALQLEPERRYATVGELADDLRRFLAGRPITARPDSLGYRTRKVLARHPWVAPVAVAALLVVVAFGVVVARYTRQLERERGLAEEEAARAQEVQEFLVGLFRSADVQANPDPERGPSLTVVEAMDMGRARLEETLQDRPRVRAEILLAIAQTYRGLTAFDKGFLAAQEALRIFTELDGPNARKSRDALRLAGLMASDWELAQELLSRHLELALQAEPIDVDEVADARLGLADHYIARRSHVAATIEQARAVLAMQGPAGPSPDRLGEAARLLAELDETSSWVSGAGEPEVTAVEWARRALAWKLEALGPEPTTGGALAHGTLAKVLAAEHRFEEAEEHYRTAMDWLDRVGGASYRDRLVQVNNLAYMYLQSGEHEKAEALLGRGAELAEEAWGEDSKELGDFLQNRGYVLTQLGRPEEALLDHRRAAEIIHATYAPEDARRFFPDLSLAGLYLELGRPAAALEQARPASEALASLLPPDHFVTAVARCRVARALVAQGQVEEAAAYFDLATPVLLTTGTYRRECLGAAADFAELRGDGGEALEIRAVLATLEDRAAPSD